MPHHRHYGCYHCVLYEKLAPLKTGWLHSGLQYTIIIHYFFKVKVSVPGTRKIKFLCAQISLISLTGLTLTHSRPPGVDKLSEPLIARSKHGGQCTVSSRTNSVSYHEAQATRRRRRLPAAAIQTICKSRLTSMADKIATELQASSYHWPGARRVRLSGSGVGLEER